MVPAENNDKEFFNLDQSAGVFLRPDTSHLNQAEAISSLAQTISIVNKIRMYVLEGKYKGIEARTVASCLDWLTDQSVGLEEIKEELRHIAEMGESKTNGKINGRHA